MNRIIHMNYTYTNSFFTLCIELTFASKLTKFYPSCPQHKKNDEQA